MANKPLDMHVWEEVKMKEAKCVPFQSGNLSQLVPTGFRQVSPRTRAPAYPRWAEIPGLGS